MFLKKSEGIRYCKDCKYSVDNIYCGKFEYKINDLVRGTLDHTCQFNRSPHRGRCGLKGKGFEPKALEG